MLLPDAHEPLRLFTMKALIPHLVALALEAPQERIEQAIRVLKGDEKATPLEPFLTAIDVAKRLNVSRVTIHRWKIPSHQLGGKPRFRMSEVLKYLDSQEFRLHAEILRRTRAKARKKL
jgi:excisionase family DNA binding protein